MASAAIHYATTATIKPSRSEDLVDPQQQILIEEAVRRKFDEEAPKRHRKPLRSDIDSDGNVQTEYFDDLNDDHEMPPEYIKLQSLVHDSADQVFALSLSGYSLQLCMLPLLYISLPYFPFWCLH